MAPRCEDCVHAAPSGHSWLECRHPKVLPWRPVETRFYNGCGPSGKFFSPKDTPAQPSPGAGAGAVAAPSPAEASPPAAREATDSAGTLSARAALARLDDERADLIGQLAEADARVARLRGTLAETEAAIVALERLLGA